MDDAVPVPETAFRALLGDAAGTVEVLRRSRLTGGIASPCVERVTVRLQPSGGPGHRLGRRVEIVAKRSHPTEVSVLAALAPLAEPTHPTVLAAGADHAGPWLLLPFYDGGTLGLVGTAPPAVWAGLARVHHWIPGRGGAVEDLPHPERLDPTYLTRLLGPFADAQLERAAAAGFDPDQLRRAERLLTELRADDDVRYGSERFTPVLMHGDAYGENVLPPTADRPYPVLIDWDAAKIGPAWYDLAIGGVTFGSTEWLAYAEAWRDASGEPPDEPTARLGLSWAVAVVNASHAAVVAWRGGAFDAAAQMIADAEAALADFRRSLARRPGRPRRPSLP